MMPGFTQALPIVFEAEGGFSDHALDRGGKTNFGITEAAWKQYCRDTNQPPRPIETIRKADAMHVYHRNYWLESKAQAFPWPLSLVHFDGWVNHGPQAAKLLQRALGVADDGIIGPQTITAGNRGDPVAHADTLLWGRMRFYSTIVVRDPSQRAFLIGWVNRLGRLREYVHGTTPVPPATEAA